MAWVALGNDRSGLWGPLLFDIGLDGLDQGAHPFGQHLFQQAQQAKQEFIHDKMF